MMRVLGFAVAGLLLIALGFVGGTQFVTRKWQADARQITATSDSAQHELLVAIDSLTSTVRHDTVRVVRSVARVDTLLQHRIDTAVVHHFDTVKVTVAEARAVQDTVRACVDVLRTCALASARYDSVAAIWATKEKAYQAQLGQKSRRAWMDRLKDMGTGAAISGAVTLLSSLVHR